MPEHPIPALSDLLSRYGARLSVLAGEVRFDAEEAADRAGLMQRVGREWGLGEDEVTQEVLEDWMQAKHDRENEE